MSANIKKLSFFANGRLLNFDLQGNKFIRLQGSKRDKDTFLYVLERFLARDFDGYYTSIDENLGVTYNNVDGSTLQYVNGISSLLDGKIVFRGAQPNLHCIRFTKGDRIRSFLVDDNLSGGAIGYNMTTFNSVISDSKWNRLVTLANNLVGYEFVKLDIKSRSINFDIHSHDSWSEEGIKLVYLLLSESMLTPDKYTRVTLLSEINFPSENQLVGLLKALSAVSRSELVVLSDNLGGGFETSGLKVLSLTV